MSEDILGKGNLDPYSVEKFTLEDIKRLCLQYDKLYGYYPESYYEGMALYEFIIDSLDTKRSPCEFTRIWKKEMRNVS
jgi:hypothetical protein